MDTRITTQRGTPLVEQFYAPLALNWNASGSAGVFAASGGTLTIQLPTAGASGQLVTKQGFVTNGRFSFDEVTETARTANVGYVLSLKSDTAEIALGLNASPSTKVPLASADAANVLRYNTCYNGNWGTEQVLTVSPNLVGRQVSYTLTIYEEKVTLSIDDTVVFTRQSPAPKPYDTLFPTFLAVSTAAATGLPALTIGQVEAFSYSGLHMEGGNSLPVKVEVAQPIPATLTPNAQPIKTQPVDALGRIHPLSSFGVPLTVTEKIEIAGKFPFLIPSKTFTKQIEGAGFDVGLYNSSLSLVSGTGVGVAKLESRYGAVYQPGVGKIIKFSVFFDPNAGDANNRQEFGYGNANNHICLRMVDGLLHLVLRQNGVDILDYPSNQWNVPVTPDGKGHLIYIALEWMGVGNIYLTYDEQIVHTIPYLGNFFDPSFWTPDARIYARNYTTGATSKSYRMRVVACAVCAQGDTPDPPVLGFYAANADLVTCTSNAWQPVLTVVFNGSLHGAVNVKIARMLSMLTGANRTASFRLVKNGVVTGGTRSFVDAPVTPQLAPTVTVSSSGATGTGYADGQSVSYVITAYGAYWNGVQTETTASAAASASVGTPKKQVTLSWNPLSNAAETAIYRSVNGGAYQLVAVVPIYQQTWTDNAAPVLSAKSPPTTSNAKGDAFMEKIEGGTLLKDANGNPTTGQVLMIMDDGSNVANVNQAETNFINLVAGESLTLEAMLTQNGTSRATMAWQGVY